MAAIPPVTGSGFRAPAFELPATDGKRYARDTVAGPNGLLVMFICNHCPFVKAVLDKIVHPKSVRSKHTAPTHAYPDGVRFAALMAIMAAKKKPLAEVKLADLTAGTELKVRYGASELPPKRVGGVKVKDVKELVAKLKTEAKVI